MESVTFSWRHFLSFGSNSILKVEYIQNFCYIRKNVILMNSCSGYCHMSLVAEEIMWLLWRLWDSGDFIRVWLLVPHNLDNFSNSPEQISCENKPVWENWKFIISDQKLSPKTPTKLKCAQDCKCIFSNLLAVAICLQRRNEKKFLNYFCEIACTAMVNVDATYLQSYFEFEKETKNCLKWKSWREWIIILCNCVQTKTEIFTRSD